MDTIFLDSSRDTVSYAMYALVFGATFMAMRTLMQAQESREAQDNLDDKKGRDSSNFLVRITRPFFSQYVLPQVRTRPNFDAMRREFRRKIIAAGLRDELTPDEFISFKIILIAFFPIVGGLLQALDMIDFPAVIILLTGAVGWFYPNIWLNSRIQARQKLILRSLPFIVDLLALSTEAGLDFVGAIGKVVEKAKPSPLIDELAQLLREIKIGASRQQALREMAARIDMSQVNSLVAILISADQMGASIGKILRQQSESIRQDRTVRAEKAGAEAGSKMMFPIMFCIVPAVFLMIIGPVALGFLSGGGGQ